MNCGQAKKAIELLMEGQEAGNKEFSAHLKECKECASEYKAVKAMKAAMSMKEKTVIPGNFNAGVWNKLGQESPSVFDRLFGSRPNARLALQATAAAAALIFMVVMAQKSFVKNETVAAKPAVVKLANKAKSQKSKVKIENRAAEQKNAPAEIAVKPEAPVEKQELAIVPAGQQAGPDEQGKGPGAAPDKTTINIGQPRAGQEIAKAPGQGDVSAASVSACKNPTPTPTTEVMNEPVIIKNNVFNPLQGQALAVKYQIKTACQVTIEVYNKKGELVASVYRGSRASGIYEDSWNGRESGGAVAPAGMYIIYVKTDLAEKKIKAAVVK